MDSLILGAGAAGLGAGLTLHEAGHSFQILERDKQPGGLATTDDVDGFSYDRTGHVLHFRSPAVQRRIEALSVPLERIERRAAVLVQGREIPYPVQYNLRALESPAFVRSLLAGLEVAGNGETEPPSSFGELLRRRWGPPLFSFFFGPYNEKLWGRPLDELPPDCGGRYSMSPDLALAREGAQRCVHFPGYNGTFLYPVSGRLGDLLNSLATPVRHRIRCGAGVTSIDLRRRQLVTTAGESISYERLISTIPLPNLLAMARIASPQPGLFAANQIMNVRIGVRGRLRTRCHWIYVPDPELPFHRIGFPRNVNHRTCPDGCASLSVEYTLPQHAPPATIDALAVCAIDFASRNGLLEVDEVKSVTGALISPAYVVRRAPGRAAFAELAHMLNAHGVALAGRFGTWDYFSVEEAFVSGARAADSSTAEVA